MKPVAQTRLASSDIEQALGHYAREASVSIAQQLLQEVDEAFAHIAQFPGTGSPRYAELSSAKGLRFWRLNRFPLSVFYIEHDDRIEIIRVLHQARDIPEHLKKNQK